MHIIMGDQITKELSEKYIILELDSFRVDDKSQPMSAFCLVENVPLNELPQAEEFQDLHAQMIKNYRQGNWKFCQDALEHLVGRWNGEADSFYHTISERIFDLQQKDTNPEQWDPAIKI